MDIFEFKELVNKVRLSNPIWFGLPADNIADDLSISNAETSLGVKLPIEYIEFVKEFGGGFFALGTVYSLDEESDINIVNENKKYNNIRESNIIFSDNGAGDLYGFKEKNSTCDGKVYEYDHEKNEWSK